MSAKVCPQCNTEYAAEQRFCPSDGATLKAAPGGADDLIGSVIADRYHVIRKLGEGGMGQVFLAEHVRMGRKSAVKVMNPGMVHDTDAISRFNREASNASRINHPHVAAIYDFGETPEGLIYLAMEYVDGEPLTAIIERQGALAAARAATIVRQAADALGAAHAHGIVHRDLKPDNIMIARSHDGSDCVKIVDFGIAKAAHGESQRVTRTGLVIGTPEYMSPEQLAGDAVDGRSDIYSLALVAFAMLTGRLPFPCATAQESMIMRLTDRPRSLAEMKPGLSWPADLQAVMDRALSRDPAQRFGDVAQFAAAFAAATLPRSSGDGPTSILSAPTIPTTRAVAAPTVAPGATGPRAAPRRARWPLIAGAASVALGAIVALGTLAPRLGEGSRPEAARTTAGPTAIENAKPDTGGRSAPAVTAGAAEPADTTPRPAPAAARDRGGLSRETARTEIVALRELALDEPELAVRRAASLLPRLTNREDSVEARFYRYQALGNSDMQTACNGFRELLPQSTGRIHDEIESAWTLACRQ